MKKQRYFNIIFAAILTTVFLLFSFAGCTSEFSIEGKWKSVGDYGFGQAQPGSIVVFDGENCNFYSPKDTYAFYPEGSDYRLDVTSFFFSDTSSFTVKVIDEDNIQIISSGNYVTELHRISK